MKSGRQEKLNSHHLFAGIMNHSAMSRASIWKYLRNYKFNSILIRYFLIIALLVILPTGLFSIIYRYNANRALQEEISDTNLNSLYRSSGMIENVMTEVYGLAYNLSVSQDCLSFVYSLRPEIQTSDLTQTLNRTIRFFTNTYDYLDSIYIYSEKEGLVVDGKSIVDLDKIADKSWLTTYQAMGESSFTVASRRKNDYYPYFMTLICPVHAGQSQTVGAVVVNVNIEGIGRLIGSNKDSTQELYILDDDYRLYFSSHVGIMDQADQIADLASLLANRSGSFSEVVQIDGRETILSGVNSEKYPWRYILLSPLVLYEKKLADTNRFMLLVSIAAAVISLIIAYFLTLKSFEPVRRIIGLVENPTPFSNEYIDSDLDNNELQHITKLVRQTQVMNSRLTLELEERMEKLNNAQLRALQGQIDPHFLYNTLDTIHWMAYEEMGDENRVSQMIVTLAQLLRVNFQRASYLVTVKEEIDHARLYVKILEIRYRDKLQVRWDIPEDMMLCNIVKLSLQPLVENALNHGLKARRYRGIIDITGTFANDFIAITVADDGIGMSQADIDQMNEHLMNNYELDDAHIGIRNLNQRIKILFGEQFGVRIAARTGDGLAVTITFPREFGQK